MRPDYFLWIALFLLRRYHYPHLILLVAATGIFSDLFAAHAWSSEALFFCIMHIAMDRIGWSATLKKIHYFWLWGIFWGSLHFFWMLFIQEKLVFRQFSAFLMVNLVAIPLLYLIFKWIRLGWSTRQGLSNGPILNA